ncbi:hypothetical protein FQN50_009278 [Emmonsiellopsis sp. PD_5]|nr:hypothetical protein FQN50_009278 [Emmonsiellopsis sp. PD_5]
MFNPDVVHLNGGLNIDRPSNAIALTTEALKQTRPQLGVIQNGEKETILPKGVTIYHEDEETKDVFSRLIQEFDDVFQDHCGFAKIPLDEWMRVPLKQGAALPAKLSNLMNITRWTYEETQCAAAGDSTHSKYTSSKLLALHQAITIILDLSAADEHIDHIIRDSGQLWVRSDGSAELGGIFPSIKPREDRLHREAVWMYILTFTKEQSDSVVKSIFPEGSLNGWLDGVAV